VPSRSSSARRAALPLLLALAACGEKAPERPAFEQSRAWSHLGQQVAHGPRVAGTPGHGRQLAWLRDQLSFRADTVVEDSFTFTPPGDSAVKLTNVLARFRPGEADRVLLVAHWDTPPRSDRDPDPLDRKRPDPGANEGASGTAVLMELAQLFREQAPPVGVDLLFVDGSVFTGDPSAGVRHFLANLPPGARYRYAVYVDRVADRDPRIPLDQGSLVSAPAPTQRLWELARAAGRDSVFAADTVPALGSDPALLIAAGIPTVVVVDREHGEGNRNWRTTYDGLDNVRAETLREVGEALAELLYREGAPSR
jgi:YD repeat-containing protein